MYEVISANKVWHISSYFVLTSSLEEVKFQIFIHLIGYLCPYTVQAMKADFQSFTACEEKICLLSGTAKNDLFSIYSERQNNKLVNCLCHMYAYTMEYWVITTKCKLHFHQLSKPDSAFYKIISRYQYHITKHLVCRMFIYQISLSNSKN